MISDASTSPNSRTKSARTASRSSPSPRRRRYPFNCSVRSAESFAGSFFVACSDACINGISPISSNPLLISVVTTSIMEIFFIFAPLGMVMIFPTEWSIVFLVISVKPSSAMIPISSGYSFVSSYTVLDRSSFFDMAFISFFS